MAKSPSAQANRDWFERQLEARLSDTDISAVREGAKLTSRWTDRGAYVGMIVFAVAGFPYPRAFTSTFVRTLSGVARNRMQVPNGTNLFSYALARSHHEGVEVTGVRRVATGQIKAGAFQRRLFVTSLVGMAWTLLGGIVGKAGGAFASIPFAEQLVRDRGGNVEAIREAANSAAGDLQRKIQHDQATAAGEQADRDRVGDSSEVMRGSSASRSTGVDGDAMTSRADQSAFIADDAAPSVAEGARAGVSQRTGRLAEAVAFDSIGRRDRTAPALDAGDVPPSDEASRSRWEELRNSKTAAPSAWEQIRQGNAKEAYNTAASSNRKLVPPSAVSPDSAADETEGAKRRREFEALMERERQGGGEASEVREAKSSKWF